MRYTYFYFENFKGIEKLKIDFTKSPTSKVFALVGLNESGKTTILEAINHFVYRNENLTPLNVKGYTVEDIHDIIPINKRDNFNENIIIEAGIELNEDEKQQIKEILEKEIENLKITSIDSQIVFTQRYRFVNSVYTKDSNERIWSYGFFGKKGKSKSSAKNLNNKEALKVNEFIKKKLPSILYFPNFLFEFPEKIYLTNNSADTKHIFYRDIIQDVLDSLDNSLKIEPHLVDRISSSDINHQRHLTSVIGKLNKQLTSVIFGRWHSIFGKEIRGKEIKLSYGEDDTGVYLEFNIQDHEDTYRVTERSLGFRWFFVFLLLTQFRTYRKNTDVIFLLDEPASNLHPSAQSQLLKSFEKLSKVIYTTHSHYLINPQWLEDTFVVKNEAIDYSKEDEFNSKKTKITIHKYKEFASKYPNQTSYFQPILEVLDYVPSSLEMIPAAIFVEGKNDFYTLSYFQKIYGLASNLRFIPAQGSTNMGTLISLYLGWGRNFLVLLDSDEEGMRQKAKYLDVYGNSLKEIIFSYGDIKPEWHNYELENLITNTDKLNIQKASYPDSNNYDKKTLNRSIQEMLTLKKQITLSDETLSNFSILLKYLDKKISSI